MYLKTRMHSSRMRTGHSLTVCCSLLPGGILPDPGGILSGPGGVCLVPGGLLGLLGFSLVLGGLLGPEGCLPGLGGLSLPGGFQETPCEQNE